MSILLLLIWLSSKVLREARHGGPAMEASAHAEAHAQMRLCAPSIPTHLGSTSLAAACRAPFVPAAAKLSCRLLIRPS